MLLCFPTGCTDGYSNLTPSGFTGKTPEGSNVTNTAFHAVLAGCDVQDPERVECEYHRIVCGVTTNWYP